MPTGQIRDYTHVLDIYGNFDYDPGMSCLYGKVDIENSHAKEYCEEVFGPLASALLWLFSTPVSTYSLTDRHSVQKAFSVKLTNIMCVVGAKVVAPSEKKKQEFNSVASLQDRACLK